MVKIGPPGPKVNTLDVVDGATYADTAVETWQIIKFFLEELVPVDTETFKPEDRKCHICGEDFSKFFHRAMRLPCGHCFGEPCIKAWLSPYGPAREIERWGEADCGANTCPTCRRVFFPEQTVIDFLPAIEARIKIWDTAYAHIGIALSETERQAREDLLRYLETYFARGVDIYYPFARLPSSPCLSSASLDMARIMLYTFSLELLHTNLTHVQRQLRQSLQEISVSGRRWAQTDRGEVLIHGEDYRETERNGESSKNDESEEEVKEVDSEEETEELAEGDTEEMRFFRALFR